MTKPIQDVQSNAPAGVSIAFWPANYGAEFRSEEAWLTRVETHIKSLAKKSPSFLIMPEWISEMWSLFAPHAYQSWERLKWEAETAERVMPILGKMAAKVGINLLAGSTPALDEDGNSWTNRSRLYFADGRTQFQDKCFLTPGEKNMPKGKEANALEIMTWGDKRIAVALGLDTEMPDISKALRDAHIDLLLVPSLTMNVAGYNRVCTGAKARAVELMCPVAVVGSTGLRHSSDGEPLFSNVSGAAVFVPCEQEFRGGSGVWLNTGILSYGSSVKTESGLYMAENVPVDRCRELRQSGAEMWSPRHIGREIVAVQGSLTPDDPITRGRAAQAKPAGLHR